MKYMIITLLLLSACKPAPCVDTITLVSAIPGNPSAAKCRKDQTMTTKEKMQGIVVMCLCNK